MYVLSKKEYACLHLLIPESGDEELDQIIIKARRQKISAEILANIIASKATLIVGEKRVHTIEEHAEFAIDQCDVLIQKLNNE